MCGRVALYSPPSRLARFLEAHLAAGVDPASPPHWNVGPQRSLFAVTGAAPRVLDRYRWGLVPGWAREASVGQRLFNARGETVATKPSFRSAFARRPCAIPVDGFYEWDHRPGAGRVPHYFSRADGHPLVLAGLYEHWRDPADDAAPILATCTVITTTPSADLEGIHDRMPVVLDPEDVTQWLDPADYGPDERALLLVPAPRGTLVHHPVGAAVGDVRHDGPELIEPVEQRRLFSP